jgi:hypothetical protein
MSDEPSLPPLPAVSWDEGSQSFSNIARKRTHLRSFKPPEAASTFNSSDPAVFSSDDDPGLDNYVQGRRKKRYVGTWYQQQPASSDSALGDVVTVAGPKPKRTLARQNDSGVFMGSDAESDILESLDIPVRSQRLRAPILEFKLPTMSAETKFQDLIRKCIDEGKETVDGAAMGLEDVSDDTISMLSQISHVPVIAQGVAFEPREPDLKLYLSNNLLTHLPMAMFDVNCITVLSLRANKLTELPQAIGKLVNLRELNVAQNELTYLPAELLNLMQRPTLRLLTIFPNSFPRPSLSHSRDDRLFLYEETQKNPRPAYLSRVHGYFYIPVQANSTSMLDLKSLMPNVRTRVHSHENTAVQTESGTYVTSSVDLDSLDAGTTDDERISYITAQMPPSVPSLVELVLQSCYRSRELPYLGSYLPDEMDHLRPLLDRTQQRKELGELACIRCQRMMVMPAVEWVEWDSICRIVPNSRATVPEGQVSGGLIDEIGDGYVPFVHRACSSRCAKSYLSESVTRSGYRLGAQPAEQEE